MKDKKVTAQFIVKVDDGFDMLEKSERDRIIAERVKNGEYERGQVLTVENYR
jgi:peptide subunit release factor RF-3